MTMILELPDDLSTEILSRIPVKSMKAMRLTCKQWNTLSKSKSFSKMHLGRQETLSDGEHRRIVILNHTLYLMSVFINEDPSTSPKCKLSCLNEQVQFSQVHHCEGLLLCILEKDKSKVVVWNPYWGQPIWIETRHFYALRENCDRYMYALGYVNNENKSSPSYKILRFYDDSARRSWFSWYEIYDFDSGFWTTLDDVPQEWHITCFQRGVSLKGNTYFYATKHSSGDNKDNGNQEEDNEYNQEEVNGYLICFDFTKECFGPLLNFPFSYNDAEDYVTLSCVREEKLAVLLTHNEVNPYEVDIWLTTKIEEDTVSWSKFLTLYTEPNYPLASLGFFIDEEKKIAMGFDNDFGSGLNRNTLSIVGEDGDLRKVDFGERDQN